MSLPRGAWNDPLTAFERQWSEYKRENGLLDFTDLIETCLRDVALAPKNPSVIFADEAQDLNGMQLSLVRKWGDRASYFIVAGDDDQTIYTFTEPRRRHSSIRIFRPIIKSSSNRATECPAPCTGSPSP